MLHSLARQWIHVLRQLLRPFGKNFSFLCLTRDHLRVVSAIRAWLVLVWIWREVHLVFRVHSSSCGAQCGVVHSPSELLDHRCHCNCRDLVLFVDRLRGCLRHDVVWWWIFHSWWCLRFGLGQCEADDWKYTVNSFQYPRR